MEYIIAVIGVIAYIYKAKNDDQRNAERLHREVERDRINRHVEIARRHYK